MLCNALRLSVLLWMALIAGYLIFHPAAECMPVVIAHALIFGGC